MPEKQKVTLYLSDDLHRQFKIRSAVDGETMSSMAQRAIEFYLGHAEVVEYSSEACKQAHSVHHCPRCAAALSLGESGLVLVGDHAKRPSEALVRFERAIPELSAELSGSELSNSELRSSDLSSPDLGSSDTDTSGSNDLGSDGSESRSPDEGELITC